MTVKSEDHGAAKAETPTQATAHRKEMKPWEAQEAADLAERDYEIAEAEAVRIKAEQAAKTEQAKPKKDYDSAAAKAQAARKALRAGAEALKHLIQQLQAGVQKFDAEKDDAAQFGQKHADVEKLLADLSAKKDEMKSLQEQIGEADAAEAAAKEALDQAEAMADAMLKVHMAQAKAAYLKAEAAARQKFLEKRKKFADRPDEF